MQKALTALEKTGQARGLTLYREKCASISFVKAGNKLKVITKRQFKFVDGFMVKQIKPSESIKMLGMLFDPAGIKKCMGNFDRELMRITKVPLKPQQRLKILRSFLIPTLTSPNTRCEERFSAAVTNSSFAAANFL